MLSRLFWIGLAGLALIGGMILQDGGGIFSWGDHQEVSAKAERAIEERVEHAIDRSFDKMQVTGSDGREIEVPAEAKRAMADAVGRLVKAEANLAIARAGDSSDEEIAVVRTQRDKARAEVDRLEAQIRGYDRAASSETDALREQIRREIREDIRATVRESVQS
jgi:hypothetical protein